MPDFLAGVTLGQVGLVVGLIAAVIGGGMKAWPWLSRLKNTLDDWMGEPARPGVAARPGLMERMAAREEREVERDAREAERDAEVKLLRPVIDEISERVARVEYNSQPNGGGSAHDAIMREIAETRDAMSSRLDEQAAAIAYLAGDKSAIDDMAEALPIIARSTPHECDAPHPDAVDEPTGP